MALIDYTNEYGQLKKVALYKPRANEIYIGNPDDVMYSSLPDPQAVLKEFDGIVAAFQKLDIEVVVLEDFAEEYPNTPNMIFLRDVAAVIDDKVVISNMKYDVRKKEPLKFQTLLMKHDTAYNKQLVILSDDATLEGADILVINSKNILAYTGYRTSKIAVQEIEKLLKLTATNIQANINHIPQHLLGGVHVISSDIIARRPTYCKSEINGFRYIDFNENDEIVSRYSMNIVTISPKEILMPSGCPITQKQFESYGITCHLVDIEDIHKMGGGLACMTLPLMRDKV